MRIESSVLPGPGIMTDMTAANNNEAAQAPAPASGADGGLEPARVDGERSEGPVGPGGTAAPTAAGASEIAADAAALAAHAGSLAAEVGDLKDRLLRALAEMENLRRRTEREVADSRTYAVTGFARDLILVADNMRRAVEAAGGVIAEGPGKSLLEGVELTERELLKVLEKHGVKKFDPKGAKFDPNLHQAMFEVPDSEVPSGSVAQVVQAGYIIGERVLRPAMVGVSKGGSKAAPPERDAEEQQSR
jgi:molecular chaperone GrpE